MKRKMNCANCNKKIENIINNRHCQHILCEICESTCYIKILLSSDKLGCNHVVTDNNNRIIKKLFIE